jgi:hypothetical protein
MKTISTIIFFIIFSVALQAQDKPSTENSKWEKTLNNKLKGNNGQLMINLPAEAWLQCMVARAGETKNIASLRNGMPKELPAGNYTITFVGIKIPVAVEQGNDSRIKAGVLQSTVKGLWEIWADGIKIFSAGAPKFVALPAGNYIVKTGGAEIKTAITDGKVSIFSFTKY